MKFYVYELRDADEKAFYIGKGCGQRMHHHRAKALAGEKTAKARRIRAIIKAGQTFTAVAVFHTDDETAAFAEEIRLIAFYGRDNLTNLTAGGDGISNPSAEVREKIAASRRGMVFSPEHRAKLSAAKIGKPRTAETRAKISAFQKGSKHPWAKQPPGTFQGLKHKPETITKMRAAKLGHIVTDETRRKISETKRLRRAINQETEQ